MLCDPKNVLTRINKNLVYEIINNRVNPDKPISKKFIDKWYYFIFNFYFKLLFTLAENANLEQITLNWKNIYEFNSKTSVQELTKKAVTDKKVLVSVFKVPDWLANQEFGSHTAFSKHSFVLIKFNPKDAHGKKITVSYHKGKMLEDVRDAEIKYVPILTRKSLVAIGFGILFFITNWIDETFKGTFNGQAFDYLFLIAAFLLVIYDIYSLITNLIGGKYNAVITTMRKTMANRIDSSATFIELEHLYRLQRSLMGKQIIEYVRFTSINMNEISPLFHVLNKKYPGVSMKILGDIIQEMLAFNILEVDSRGFLSVTLDAELIDNAKVIDERLYELFDPQEQITSLIYRTYENYVDVVNLLLMTLNKPKLDFPKC